MKLVVVDHRGGLLPFAARAVREGSFEDVAIYQHHPVDPMLHAGLIPTWLRSGKALTEHLEGCDPAATVVVASGCVAECDSVRDRHLLEAGGAMKGEVPPPNVFGSCAAGLRTSEPSTCGRGRGSPSTRRPSCPWW